MFQSIFEKMTWHQMSNKQVRDNSKRESFVSDQAKDPNVDANTIQTKKKRKHNKKKSNSKVNISESNRNRCEEDTINNTTRG